MTPYVSGIAVLSYLSGKLPSYDGKRLRTAAGMCSLSLPPGCRTRGLFLAVDLFRGLFHMFHDVPCRSEGVQRPARFSDCIRPCRCGVYPGFQQSFRHIDLAESDVYVGDRLAVEVAVDFRIFSAVGEVECTETATAAATVVRSAARRTRRPCRGWHSASPSVRRRRRSESKASVKLQVSAAVVAKAPNMAFAYARSAGTVSRAKNSRSSCSCASVVAPSK